MITMNERMKDLVGQAKFMAEESINKKISANDELYAFAEKFAELIVLECVSIVNKRKDAAIDANWLVDEAMSHAVWDIEEHFGVEECGTKN